MTLPPAPAVAAARPPDTESTASASTRALGGATVAGVALLVAFSFWWSPADQVQGDSVRLMYIHVPSAIWAFGCCALTTVSSASWLRRRTDGWWVLGGAAAELALVLTGLTLLTGSIWGRPTWGTWWQWDPRMTSTALLFVMLVGFLGLRAIDDEAGSGGERGRRSSIVGLLLFPNVVIVHFSVDWWDSLHQKATITRLDPTIEGTMLFTLMLGIIVFGLGVAWLMVHRFRVGWLVDRAVHTSLDEAISLRREEAVHRSSPVASAVRGRT